jgi:hypothetical protein
LTQIEAIVAAARGKPDELALIRAGIEALPGTIAGDGTHWNHEVAIAAAMGRRFDQELEALEKLRELELSVAPQVVGTWTTDRSQVIIRRYAACKGERLIKVSQEPVKLTPAARARVREDLTRLADAGFMHPWASRGATYWRVGEQTGTIVLEAWAVLQPLHDRADLLQKLDHALASYG